MTVLITSRWGVTITVDDEDADLLPDRYARPRNKAKNAYVHAKGGGNMGRIILSRKLGRELLASERVDHENLNKMDNRRSNLRLATQQQNCVNVDKKRRTRNLYKGAYRTSSGRYSSYMAVDGKHTWFGTFDTAIEAHRVWCIASLKQWGEFSNFGSNSPFAGWQLIDFERGYKQLELPLFLEAA